MAKHPEGYYTGVITEHGVQESKNGNVEIVFRVGVDQIDDPISGGTKPYNAFVAYVRQYPCTDESRRITGEILKSLGITDVSQLALEGDKSPCIGKEVKLRNKHDTYEGEHVDRFSFTFGSKPIENSAGALQKLKGMFGNSLKSGAAPKKSASTPAKKPATTPVQSDSQQEAGGDDIPF